MCLFDCLLVFSFVGFWFGEGKGDILVLMCYILHNSAYPFCKSVIVTEIIVYEFCMYGNKDFSI